MNEKMILVPVDLTEEMLAAGCDQMPLWSEAAFRAVWSAMLNSAPTPSPPVQLSERERAAVARLNALSSVLRAEAAEKDGQARQDDLDDAGAIHTILAALTRTTGEG